MGHPIAGANLLLSGTYDGTTSDSTGYFNFTSNETSRLTIIYSALGYQADSITVELETASSYERGGD